MLYIPREWVKDPNNIEEIHKLLSEINSDVIGTNMNAELNYVYVQLEQIGETTIIDKLKSGEIILGL